MNRPDRIFKKIASREGYFAWFGWILMPFGWLYGSLAALRRMWFESGRRQFRLPVPVISVGNIEVGGTGKTSVTIWLARRIAGMGFSVAVVARNFGKRESACRVRLDNPDVRKEFTDEVLLLAESLLGKARVYAGRSKTEASVRAFREENPDIIIIDDGFQHLKLHRDIELVVLDFSNPFGQGGILPAGTLREFPSFISRADHIWINRITPGMSAEWIKRRVSDYNWKALVQFSRIQPTGIRLTSGRKLSDIPEAPVLAFCGIGKPESFQNSLEEAGFNIRKLVIFPDHHIYSAEDIEQLKEIMRKKQATALITTEKDAVKLTGIADTDDILVQTMNLEVEGAIPELLDDIQNTIQRFRELRDR